MTEWLWDCCDGGQLW